MVERCGDRQRKLDGLKKWPFRFFMDNLIIIPQATVFVFACGLSLYMWPVNTSITSIIIFFTLLILLFYIGTLIAGTSSYECPFQTPVSMAFLKKRHQAAEENTHKELPLTTPTLTTPALTILPLATMDSRPMKLVTPGLQVPVQTLQGLQRQDIGDGCCVGWILQRITEPEALEFVTRLAGAIRWSGGAYKFDRSSFDAIAVTFESCFNSTQELRPGMKDRAYFSVQAMLRINTWAKAQLQERPFGYLAISQSIPDPDLRHIISMFNQNFATPTLDFPRTGINTPAHSLWMSNLFLDLIRIDPKPTLKSYTSYLSAAIADNQAVIANTLIMWYMSLGGDVEEETFWVDDKSYAVFSFPFFPPAQFLGASGSLENILFHLSTKVVSSIADQKFLQHLNFLFEFLVAWKKRPVSLIGIAYQWCVAIADAATKLEEGHTQQAPYQLRPRYQSPDSLPSTNSENYFALVGCPYPPDPGYPILGDYTRLLFIALEIGFRQVVPRSDTLQHPQPPSYDWILNTAFSSNDDDIIADAMSILIAKPIQSTSLLRYFSKRFEQGAPISQRLLRVSADAIESASNAGLVESGLEVIHFLNQLDIGEVEVTTPTRWAMLLVWLIRSVMEPWTLSRNYWSFLGKEASTNGSPVVFVEGDLEVIGILEAAGKWEELGVWMMVLWLSREADEIDGKSVGRIKEATRRLLLHWPSVLPRFEALSNDRKLLPAHRYLLEEVCRGCREGGPPP